MSGVGVLIVAHDPVGSALLGVATAILGNPPLPIENLPVPLDVDTEMATDKARILIRNLNQGAGVLVLTDMYGSTPANIACRLLADPAIRVVSGLNLPMLCRIFNYAALDLEQLAEKAADGARDSILLCAVEEKR